MVYGYSIGGTRYSFPDLRTVLAKASPERSGDHLADLAAESARERVAAKHALADIPLTTCLEDWVIPPEEDEVTRMIVETHDPAALAPVGGLTFGAFRDFLLSEAATSEVLAALRPGLTPEMVAGVSKLMRIQDLALVGAKCQVRTAFRNSLGGPGVLASRLQPNHPTDDTDGIVASIIDGVSLAAGDAVIGVNPVSDSLEDYIRIVSILDDVRLALGAPVQGCCLGHITTAIQAVEAGAPVDLMFQSVAGSEKANEGFGVTLEILREGHQAALSLNRGTVGPQAMYFETGQGSALSADAHHGVDQQTLEARAQAVARCFDPLIVNSVVGFIGPEYLYDGKQIIRAGLEDHFTGKMLGLPMGMDVCYTNHAEADGDDMDMLSITLASAGVTFLIAVPGADDVMLNYQSLSYHDIAALRRLTGLRPAPEFDQWLQQVGLTDAAGLLRAGDPTDGVFARSGWAGLLAATRSSDPVSGGQGVRS